MEGQGQPQGQEQVKGLITSDKPYTTSDASSLKFYYRYDPVSHTILWRKPEKPEN